jgi:hypothetical protein
MSNLDHKEGVCPSCGTLVLGEHPPLNVPTDLSTEPEVDRTVGVLDLNILKAKYHVLVKDRVFFCPRRNQSITVFWFGPLGHLRVGPLDPNIVANKATKTLQDYEQNS